ncbi:MAG: protein-glutamate O-methyltransferase CheR [Peptococcaceae bacterium]|nr:protein-glutamate O-methyltransferase CheR [Peptococcaceae bacterium]
MIKLTDQEFETLTTFVKRNYGINLEKKRVLLEGRLNSVLIEKGCKTFSDYIKILQADRSGIELSVLLNKVTTNHTFFMREPKHFEFLKNTILPEQEKINTRKQYNIWSAGCSVGAEVYTTAMTLHDYFGVKKSSWRFKMLATDISQNVLGKAKEGIYQEDLIKDVSPAWKNSYFKKLPDGQYQVQDSIRKDVEFRVLNLMDNFTFPTKFNLIFCRNVMIYFDQETRNQLINRFYNVLEPGGYLFIGHSETIQRETTKFNYIAPAIYRKEA